MKKGRSTAKLTDHTQKLANYVVNLQYDSIPHEVIERVKIMTLHTIGVSLAASPIQMTKDVANIAIEMNGGRGGGASLWVTGEQVSPMNAAFANGASADMLDWEDCAWAGHPLCGTIPAGIGFAEANKKSGREFLEAAVAGFEVYQRVSMAVQPPKGIDHVEKGWGICNWQIFSACVPAAKLLNLSSKQVNQALGMACTLSTIASNLAQATMSDSYNYQQAVAAQSGALSALIAKYGIRNLEGCFDIPYAYGEHLTPEVDNTWFNRNLDNHFYTMDILLKHWPANMWVQTPVELVDMIIKENDISADQIEEIIVNPPTIHRMRFREDGFTSLTEAQFSMPYVIASVILEPSPGANWYTDEMMINPKLIELAQRVKAGTDPGDTLASSFEAYQNGTHPTKHVTIITKDGRVFEKSLSNHKGHPANMFTWEEICNLFRQETASVYTPAEAQKMIEYVMNIENMEDLSGFNQLLPTKNHQKG